MSRFVPDRTQYQDKLKELSGDLRSTLILRIPSETGMAREELVTIKRTDLDRIHKRGLWLGKSKKVRQGKKKDNKWIYVERNREVPINSDLYTLIRAYLDTHTSPYIIDRLRMKDKAAPLTPAAVNYIFDNEIHIPWSPHDCRHFFRSQVRYWMIKNKQIDMQVIKEIMGHVLEISEKYGGESPFEYKLDIVDKVFG